MVMTPAERARAYRARKGAKPRTELAPCGTLAAWNRHVRQRAKLRRDGVPETELPPIDAECRQAAQRHQQALRARRSETEASPAPVVDEPPVEAAPIVDQPTRPAAPVKLVRHTDPRTAATFYTWQHPAGVHLEARRRRFPDGRQRWELHHLDGSTIPAVADHADPVGDNWVRLGDLRIDLDRLGQALDQAKGIAQL